MRTVLFTGRFQPFHDGHVACIRRLQGQGNLVIVGIRSGPPTEKNPYPFEQRRAMVAAKFPDVHVVELPDPGHDFAIAHGRDVGYEVLKMDTETEAISATKIRGAAN